MNPLKPEIFYIKPCSKIQFSAHAKQLPQPLQKLVS